MRCVHKNDIRYGYKTTDRWYDSSLTSLYPALSSRHILSHFQDCLLTPVLKMYLPLTNAAILLCLFSPLAFASPASSFTAETSSLHSRYHCRDTFPVGNINPEDCVRLLVKLQDYGWYTQPYNWTVTATRQDPLRVRTGTCELHLRRYYGPAESDMFRLAGYDNDFYDILNHCIRNPYLYASGTIKVGRGVFYALFGRLDPLDAAVGKVTLEL